MNIPSPKKRARTTPWTTIRIHHELVMRMKKLAFEHGSNVMHMANQILLREIDLLEKYYADKKNDDDKPQNRGIA